METTKKILADSRISDKWECPDAWHKTPGVPGLISYCPTCTIELRKRRASPPPIEHIPDSDFNPVPFQMIKLPINQFKEKPIKKMLSRYSLKTGAKEYIVYAANLAEAQTRFPPGVPGTIMCIGTLADEIRNGTAKYGEDVSPINIANKRYEAERKRREKENESKV